MASLNKVMIIGNLTRDPELRYTKSGAAVCELGIAVNRKYMVNNQPQEETTFVDIIVWNKQAESCSKYLQKGKSVFIDGRLKLDAWENKDGEKRSKMRVVAERVQFLSSTGQQNQVQSQQEKQSQQINTGQGYPQHNNERADFQPQQQQQQQQNNYNQRPAAPSTARKPNQQQSMPKPPDNYNSQVEDDIPF